VSDLERYLTVPRADGASLGPDGLVAFLLAAAERRVMDVLDEYA
jgi:hypothetical protein